MRSTRSSISSGGGVLCCRCTINGSITSLDSVSPSLTGSNVLISLLAYMAVYLFMYPSGVLLMWRAVKKGPTGSEEFDAAIEAGPCAASSMLVARGHSGGCSAHKLPANR